MWLVFVFNKIIKEARKMLKRFGISLAFVGVLMFTGTNMLVSSVNAGVKNAPTAKGVHKKGGHKKSKVKHKAGGKKMQKK